MDQVVPTEGTGVATSGTLEKIDATDTRPSVHVKEADPQETPRKAVHEEINLDNDDLAGAISPPMTAAGETNGLESTFVPDALFQNGSSAARSGHNKGLPWSTAVHEPDSPVSQLLLSRVKGGKDTAAVAQKDARMVTPREIPTHITETRKSGGMATIAHSGDKAKKTTSPTVRPYHKTSPVSQRHVVTVAQRQHEPNTLETTAEDDNDHSAALFPVDSSRGEREDLRFLPAPTTDHGDNDDDGDGVDNEDDSEEDVPIDLRLRGILSRRGTRQIRQKDVLAGKAEREQPVSMGHPVGSLAAEFLDRKVQRERAVKAGRVDVTAKLKLVMEHDSTVSGSPFPDIDVVFPPQQVDPGNGDWCK